MAERRIAVVSGMPISTPHVAVIVSAAIQSGIARPATIRSEALPSRTFRDAIQPTAMNAAYIATTAATGSVKSARLAREWEPLRSQERGVSRDKWEVVHEA